jgi:hypothetical protein
MNFAVRNVLAIALIEAVQAPYQWQTTEQVLTTAQIAQQVKNAIWRVECTTI